MIHQVGRVHQKLIDGVYRNYSTNCTFITLHKPVKTLNMMYTIISLVHCLVCVSWQVLVETLLQHQGHILAPPLSTMFQPSNCCIYWLNNPVWIHYQLLFLQANGKMATLGVLLSLTNKPWWINILTVFPFPTFQQFAIFTMNWLNTVSVPQLYILLQNMDFRMLSGGWNILLAFSGLLALCSVEVCIPQFNLHTTGQSRSHEFRLYLRP